MFYSWWVLLYSNMKLSSICPWIIHPDRLWPVPLPLYTNPYRLLDSPTYHNPYIQLPRRLIEGIFPGRRDNTIWHTRFTLWGHNEQRRRQPLAAIMVPNRITQSRPPSRCPDPVEGTSDSMLTQQSSLELPASHHLHSLAPGTQLQVGSDPISPSMKQS